MVAVTGRSTLLATVCSMAVLSNLTDAAVLPSTKSTLSHRESRQNLQEEQAQAPTVPLPAAATIQKEKNEKLQAKDTRKKHDKKGSKRHKYKKEKSHHRLREQFFVQDPSHMSLQNTSPPLPHSERSILIDGPKSAAYIIQKLPRTHGSDKKRDIPIDRRAENNLGEGVMGCIDIMSADPNSPKGKKLASLSLESDSANASSSKFVLNASSTSQTQFFLVPIGNTTTPLSNTASGTSSDAHVMLQVPVFDPSQMEMKPYCATFDPRPSGPESMTVQSCDENVTEHKSQMFSYNQETGVIRPMWYNGEDDGKTDSQSTDPKTSDVAGVASITSVADGNPTMTPSTANSTGSCTNRALADRDAASAPPQNVTLMFTPAAPAVPYQEKGNATMASASVVTETMTVTSTATTTQSVAAQDLSTSSTSLSMTTSSPTAAPTTLTAASIESTTTAGVPAMTTSTTSMSSSASTTQKLNVQVVAASTTAMSSADLTATSLATSASSDMAEDVAASVMALYSGANAIAASATGATTSVVVAEASGMVSSSGSVQGSSSSSAAIATQMSGAPEPTMTPVSTAPYKWMFTARKRL